MKFNRLAKSGYLEEKDWSQYKIYARNFAIIWIAVDLQFPVSKYSFERPLLLETLQRCKFLH